MRKETGRGPNTIAIADIAFVRMPYLAGFVKILLVARQKWLFTFWTIALAPKKWESRTYI